MTERAVFKIHIDGSKEAIWQEITRTDVPQPAFYDTALHVVEPAVGRPYQMKDSSGRFVNSLGEILEWDPPNKLSQSARFTQYDEPPVIITYELEDADTGGVDLTLTVDKVDPTNKTGKGLTGSGGGDWICQTLKEIVEDGKPRLGTRLMFRVGRLLNPVVMPKRSRAEHWPIDDH